MGNWALLSCLEPIFFERNIDSQMSFIPCDFQHFYLRNLQLPHMLDLNLKYELNYANMSSNSLLLVLKYGKMFSFG